ncbi:hypothetical protein AAG570_001097 [Ranatra chinensis]|uniref:DUF1279 domain-containing protein n=1 Tax=Ranatra chinensis TaxID=642074 RepID=A0ABD0YAV4_9HEMI
MSGGGGSSGDSSGDTEGTALTGAQKLKRAVRDYGSTIIAFHIGISLLSLGGFYLAFSSGLDMEWLVSRLGLEGSSSKVAATGGTFVVAYAVHKVFAPLRISITLASAPLIVRYFRSIGFLKPPKSKK